MFGRGCGHAGGYDRTVVPSGALAVDLAAQVPARADAQDAREPVVGVDPALHLSRVAAVALDAVDRADRGAEALAVDHRVVRRLAGVPGAGHPVPEAGLPRDRRVRGDQVRVVQQIDAEGVAGRVVVEVPAELDRPATVVRGLAGRAAVRLGRVAVVRPVRLVDLVDVDQAAGLVVDVGQERRRLLLLDRVAAGGGERRVLLHGVRQARVRVEAVPAREHLVELGLTDHEAARTSTAAGGRGRAAASAGAGVRLPEPVADHRVIAGVFVHGPVVLPVRVAHDRADVVPLAGYPVGVVAARAAATAAARATAAVSV